MLSIKQIESNDVHGVTLKGHRKKVWLTSSFKTIFLPGSKLPCVSSLGKKSEERKLLSIAGKEGQGDLRKQISWSTSPFVANKQLLVYKRKLNDRATVQFLSFLAFNCFSDLSHLVKRPTGLRFHGRPMCSTTYTPICLMQSQIESLSQKMVFPFSAFLTFLQSQ